MLPAPRRPAAAQGMRLASSLRHTARCPQPRSYLARFSTANSLLQATERTRRLENAAVPRARAIRSPGGSRWAGAYLLRTRRTRCAGERAEAARSSRCACAARLLCGHCGMASHIKDDQRRGRQTVQVLLRRRRRHRRQTRPGPLSPPVALQPAWMMLTSIPTAAWTTRATVSPRWWVHARGVGAAAAVPPCGLRGFQSSPALHHLPSASPCPARTDAGGEGAGLPGGAFGAFGVRWSTAAGPACG